MNFGVHFGENLGNFVSNFATFFGNFVQQKGGANKHRDKLLRRFMLEKKFKNTKVASAEVAFDAVRNTSSLLNLTRPCVQKFLCANSFAAFALFFLRKSHFQLAKEICLRCPCFC